MKLLILSTFILAPTINCKQNTSPLIGSWKIVSIKNDELYYNAKKDSVAFSFSKEFDSLRKMISPLDDTLQQRIMLEGIKYTALNTRFKFQSNAEFQYSVDTLFIVRGNYAESRARQIISLSNKKSVGVNDFDLPDKIKYKIIDGLLYIALDESATNFSLILEKIQ